MCEEERKTRLKANKGWRNQAKITMEEMIGGERCGFNWKRREPWKRLAERRVRIFTRLKEEVRRDMEDEEKRRIVEETVEERGGQELVVYTDGSVEGGIVNGGAACVCVWRGEKMIVRRAAGEVCSSYGAEAVAMKEALELIERLKPRGVMICSDSQGLLTAIKTDRTGGNKIIEEVKAKIYKIAEECEVVLQWVPGHVGLEGNEWADREANKAREEEQGTAAIWFDSVKSLIRRKVEYKPEWDERIKKVYGKKIRREEDISRRESVVLAQLRSGHCAETRYYQKRIGKIEEARCEMCEEEEEKEHWLTCPAREGMRREEGLTRVEGLKNEATTIRYLRRAYPQWWA
jgi:ribonuclease HI